MVEEKVDVDETIDESVVDDVLNLVKEIRERQKSHAEFDSVGEGVLSGYDVVRKVDDIHERFLANYKQGLFNLAFKVVKLEEVVRAQEEKIRRLTGGGKGE